jgi:ABC-type multidrug transport system fused ATPase/permease subunit
MVGFIGPSGAGKTTVADLMLRLFEPTEGKITLDGVPAQEIRLEDWRRHMGYVAQDVFLLNATIEENIRFYREDVTREDIERAAKQANIYDHIMSLPEGFSAAVGDRGVMLSGGQRQRIALARALVSRPSVLILDEATSALDHESEALIQEAIEALHGSVTVVLIAHRPSTILGADRIIVLEGGRVSEEGTPAQLLRRPDSYFARMQGSA